MQKLTTLSKLMLAVIAVGSTFGAVRTYGKGGPLVARPSAPGRPLSTPALSAAGVSAPPSGSAFGASAAPPLPRSATGQFASRSPNGRATWPCSSARAA